MPLDWSPGKLQEGLRRFHSGAFFEAHEHWESVWLTAQTRRRHLYFSNSEEIERKEDR